MNTPATTETAIAEYSPTALALAELRGKYTGIVFDVATTKGMAEAKEARAELRGLRVNLDKLRVGIKAPALERCRLIDTEAKRITAELEALEDPIDEQVKRHEQAKAREKAEKEEAERQATERRNARTVEVQTWPMCAEGKTVEEIDAMIAEAMAVDSNELGTDFASAHAYNLRLAVLGLKAAKDKRVAFDAEQVQIAADRAKLKLLEDAEKERQANQEAQERAAQQKRDDDARIAREAQEAADAQARAEKDAERKREQDAEDARRAEAQKEIDAENDRKARELADAKAATDKAKREADEAKAAAEKRAEALALESADLVACAQEAVEFLTAEGHGRKMVTRKLVAALANAQAVAA